MASANEKSFPLQYFSKNGLCGQNALEISVLCPLEDYDQTAEGPFQNAIPRSDYHPLFKKSPPLPPQTEYHMAGAALQGLCDERARLERHPFYQEYNARCAQARAVNTGVAHLDSQGRNAKLMHFVF